MFNKLFISIALSLCFSTAMAAERINSGALLIDGCIELVGIYKNKKDKYLLAGQTTSLSEAMKAGYCRGAIEQYIQSARPYCLQNWYEIAEQISRLDKSKYKSRKLSKLVELGCGG